MVQEVGQCKGYLWPAWRFQVELYSVVEGRDVGRWTHQTPGRRGHWAWKDQRTV